MDLLSILRERIRRLPEGAHTPGLRAVLQHVDAAMRHLERGGESRDDSAFSDVIYRTNQAYEGSLKEAYRLLAEKDPRKLRAADIEAFFQSSGALRERVLTQLSRYRTEWRNPSTHDYRLDFDEDEALLAIVSVCGLAIVLVDQMVEKTSFDRAYAGALNGRADSAPIEASHDAATLTEQLVKLLRGFDYPPDPLPREPELVGALCGYLNAQLSGATVQANALVGEGAAKIEVDLLVATDAANRVAIEVKRSGISEYEAVTAQDVLERIRALPGIRNAIVYFVGPTQMFVYGNAVVSRNEGP